MKMNCDIIQDLIPSYVDEICSDASKRCVEEHIAECESCKNVVKLYRENEFTGKRMEQREIDGFKKLKAKMKRQNIVSLCLMLVVIGFGVHIFISNNVDFPLEMLYVFLIICLIATLFVGKGKAQQDKATKKEYLLLAGSVLASIYPVCMYYWIFKLFEQGVVPFGMEAHDLGPFIHIQWGILCLLQIMILEELLRSILKKNRNCHWMLPLNLAGIFILLCHTYMLGHNTTADAFLQGSMKMIGIVITLAVIGSVVHLLVRKHSAKR